MSADSTLWWGLAWLLLTALVFSLPLWPAFAELRRRRDAQPIAIDSEDSGETEYRIKLLAPRLPLLRELRGAPDWQVGGGHVLPGGTHLAAARSDGPVTLDGGASADVLITEQTLTLGAGSGVAQLAHAARIVSRGPVHLDGRTSADTLVVLAAGSHVFRVAAPCIVTAPLTAAPSPAAALPAAPLSAVPRRHEGDFRLEAGQRLSDNLVVTGDITLGEGAELRGHVKAHGSIELARGARVTGALFAKRDIRCAGDNCVLGPISAVKTVVLGAGTQAGSPSVPCSVSGWQIELGPAVAVFGTLASVDGCEVLA